MNKIQLVVENVFSNSEKNSLEINATVYDRVFNKFLKDGWSMWKIHPLYIKAWKIEKILGIVTMNIKGSYSLFLELPGMEFDHMTLWETLTSKHHLTKITEPWRRKRFMPIGAIPLSNGTHHIQTIIIGNLSILKDLPKKVIYPPVSENKFLEVKKSFMNFWKFEGSSIIDLNTEAETIFLQFFMVPKNIDHKCLMFFPDTAFKVLPNFCVDAVWRMSLMILPHDNYETDYHLGIVTSVYGKPINKASYMFFPANKEGFYYNGNDTIKMPK